MPRVRQKSLPKETKVSPEGNKVFLRMKQSVSPGWNKVFHGQNIQKAAPRGAGTAFCMAIENQNDYTLFSLIRAFLPVSLRK